MHPMMVLDVMKMVKVACRGDGGCGGFGSGGGGCGGDVAAGGEAGDGAGGQKRWRRGRIINGRLEGSDKDYELNLSMYRKAAKLEKQMNVKLAWIHEKYNHRSETHIGGSSSQTHEIGDVYLIAEELHHLTAEELHQLHLDEEALRKKLEEQTMDEKAREEKIRQKQAIWVWFQS
ncbi:hypothetical protein Tco_0227980 [Tanacetum coccineum]